MQDKKYSTIKEKIKEREKLTLIISKSFVDQKEKSKQNYLKKIETQSFKLSIFKGTTFKSTTFKLSTFESTTFKLSSLLIG